MAKIKIMLVDDHLVVREGLKQLLSLEDEIEIVAEAGSGLECLELLESIECDLIFMDIRLPGINGIETTRIVSQNYPNIKIIILTIYDKNQYVTDAIQAGAKGYVLKGVNQDELIKIIKKIMEVGAFLDSKVTAALFDGIKNLGNHLNGTPKIKFTRRELEILELLTKGYKDLQISSSLHISKYTVRSHIKNIYKKMGVSSRSQAISRALQHQFIIN